MAVRRENRKTTYSIPKGDYRAWIEIDGHYSRPVKIRYVRYILGNPSPVGWRAKPDNTVYVLVNEGMDAPDLPAGKEVAKETLEKLVQGELTPSEIPYEQPASPRRIAQFDHPTKMLTAILLEGQNGIEIIVAGYVPNGYTLPMSTPSLSTDPDFEWGRMNLSDRLVADTQDEAMAAAQEELLRYAEDSQVRDRSSAPPST